MSAIIQQKYEQPCDRSDYPKVKRHPVRLVTYNAMDPNIAGAIRTAEAFRIEHVYLLRKPQTMAAAVNQQHWQPHTYTPDLADVIRKAKSDGYTVVALEQTNQSIPLPYATLPDKMCLVAGDEGMGVPPKALTLCDMAVEIPQFGMVASLNVVTAISIGLYEWTRQHA